MANNVDPPKPPPAEDAKPEKKPDPKEDELSEEDQAIKDKLDLLVTRVTDQEPGVQKLALESIRTEIRSATSSMTSVPKPLKFLRPHFDPLKKYYAATMPEGENKVFLADVLSVLSMTMGDTSRCESLRFKLRGTSEPPHLWGHEYVRHLAGEIASEYENVAHMDTEMQDEEEKFDHGLLLKRATLVELSKLVSDIVPFLIKSNAEPEAVDLLLEVDSLADLVNHTDALNYSRVCLYLKSCADYIPEQEAVKKMLKIASDIYVKAGKLPEAMEVAIRMGDLDAIKAVYQKSKFPSAVRLQLALDLGRAGIVFDEDVEPDEKMRVAMTNQDLHKQFQSLAKDLDVLEAKTPEDIYKTHLLDTRAPSSSGLDSARANLASTFVNAFVNMGFGTDKLMSNKETRWIYRNKDHGMMSAAASVGMLYLWDIYTAINEIDKYMYAEQDYVKAGAYLGIGLVCGNVRPDPEVDPAYTILQEQISSSSTAVKHGAIAGLGLAYAGEKNENVKTDLLPLLLDSSSPPDLVALSALSLGLSYIGSADESLSSAFLQALAERKESGDVSKEPLMRIFLPLSLGLLFLGCQEKAKGPSESIEAMVGTDTLLGRIAAITLSSCAYCGSGNVEKVQSFLSICGEHLASEEDAENGDVNPSSAGAGQNGRLARTGGDGTNEGDQAGENGADQTDSNVNSEAEKARVGAAEQAVAVLGLAMVAMGEELGAEMSVRAFDHLLQYGDPVIRRVVPLAIGLLSISNPKLSLMDMLSKFTHDSDMDVAQSAIIGLGMIGAGSNNSRIAGILRQLSVYYSKEPSSLFLVRISQGLLHSGKGLVTMTPYYGDNKFLSNKTAIGGILTFLFSCLDMKGTILAKNHFLLYYLALAARPRMVYSVDDQMEFKAVPVRVGQAVDTVGQAGRPKSITGFQTHTTPVLLGAGERAEMATDEFLSVAASLEGIVVLEKNPDWVDESGLTDAVAAMESTKAKAAPGESAGAGSSKS